jgi:hypothetical protein
MRPCNCEKCYVCWLWYHNSEWRVQHGGPNENIPIPESILNHGPDSIIVSSMVDKKQDISSFVASVVSANIVLPTIARPNRCEYLQKRTEFKNGCNGWKCQHDCKFGLPAVPGVYCQTCKKYADSGDKF